MPKDLLLEIGTEEIPARFMPDILAQFAKITKDRLEKLRIGYSEVRTFGTPRRIVLVIRELAEQQKDWQTENKGPSLKIAFDAEGAPTKAAQGFARGQGVDVNSLVTKEGYVYAVINEKGRPVAELIPEMLFSLIQSLNFPKTMRWGDHDIRFVRPIRWLLALCGTECIPLTITDVVSSNYTFGHRFLSSGAITVDSVDDYFKKLADHFVMVDQEERRKVIREQVEKLAVSHGGTAEIDEELLEEVVFLVEYPTALCGTFDEAYLTLPAEAIVTPMREHQRYFPVRAEDKSLLPVFITVRNGNADHLEIVQHGNERVLRARLDDAKFFFEEDQKVTLANRVDRLKTIVFQDGLGTLYDKTLRVQRLAGQIAGKLAQDSDTCAIVERSALLAKADLVTGMVYEFTELQGIMGRQYALLNGEKPPVAQAIYEHYLPRFSGDELPQSDAGRIVSIADKMDNIVATFSRGLIPTGSQDPYALRRQSLGIVHILIDGTYHLSLQELLEDTLNLLQITDETKREKLTAEVQDFFRLRIKNVLADAGIRYDLIDSVLTSGTDDIYNTWLKANAVAANAGAGELQLAAQAFTRIANLTKNITDTNLTINPSLFANSAEQALYQTYDAVREKVLAAVGTKRYDEALTSLFNLIAPIDAFFSEVMVMVDDLPVRNNRLALLKAVLELTHTVADFSKITL